VALAKNDESLSPSDRKAVVDAYGKQAAELQFEASKRSHANPEATNALARKLATCTDPELRSPARAVELARKAIEGQPSNGMFWNTLGVAQYRAGDWKAAETTLRKSIELRSGGDSFDWFFVGMCLWQQGEKDRARTWYKAARLWTTRKSPTNNELIRFQAEAATLLGLPKDAQPTETDDLAGANALVEVVPQLSSYELRGTVHAQRREWDRADDDFTKAIELGDKTFLTRYERVLMRRAKDDKPGFQAACADMLKQFAHTEDATTANFVAWSCALGPDALTDFRPAIALAQKAVKIDAKSAQFTSALGAILYRAGQFAAARQELEAADRLASTTDARRSPPAYAWFFLAMTHHRLAHPDEAQKWLDKARAETDTALKERDAGTATLPWNRRLILTLLRREADELLNSKQKTKTGTKQEAKLAK
jgi:Flp pilus assembly protein TadD